MESFCGHFGFTPDHDCCVDTYCDRSKCFKGSFGRRSWYILLSLLSSDFAIELWPGCACDSFLTGYESHYILRPPQP